MKGKEELSKKIKNDPEFAAKFKNLESFGQAVEIAKQQGYQITEEDVKQAMQIGEEELCLVAGGKGEPETIHEGVSELIEKEKKEAIKFIGDQYFKL